MPATALRIDPARPHQGHQPFVHDRLLVLRAPLQMWSAPDGALRGEGADGVYPGDTRVVSDLRLEPHAPEASAAPTLSPLGVQVRSAGEVVLRALVSDPARRTDPLLVLERVRTASADGVAETLVLRNDDEVPRSLALRLALLTDGASMSRVKDPRMLDATGADRPAAVADGDSARWPVGADGSAVLRTAGAPIHAEGPLVTWEVTLEAPAGGEARASWRLDLTDPSVPFVAASAPWLPAGSPAPGGSVGPHHEDPERRAVTRLLTRSLSDLEALRLERPGRPEHRFLAAGAPWFLTLFGRDSLIAASLLLPVDTELAAGTLRILAASQGTRVDPGTAEQPGKILHEVRAQGMEMGETHLPPVYYGTIDATPLWIELLHDALAAGADPALLTELRGNLEAAATWLLEHADADGDGLLEYLDESGHGLANQGWKDSGDSIRFADGSLATGAIALAEVQGYAHTAALHAAELLGTGDLPERLRSWAARLRERFQEAFWCEDELGPYPALALDGAKRPVDGVASNMGHLLGTGILDPAQEEVVVARLMHPTLFSGYGIRTLDTTNGGHGPLRYHGGSVWTHDTGYVLRGLLRTGHEEEARILARGLLRAAEGFGDRLPELFGGHPAAEVEPPLPYPASCRPQAWAAASAVPIAQALGLVPIQ